MFRMKLSKKYRVYKRDRGMGIGSTHSPLS